MISAQEENGEMIFNTKLRLLSIAVTGSVITAVGLALKAGPALESLYEIYVAERNFSDKDPKEINKEYGVKAIKKLAPVVIFAASSILFIAEIVKEAKKERRLMAEDLYFYTKEHVRNSGITVSKPKEELMTSKSEIFVYEPYSGQYFTTTLRVLDRACMKNTRRLTENYRVSLNRFIRDAGGKPTSIGDYIGWDLNSDEQMPWWSENEPSIDIYLSREFEADGKFMNVLAFNVQPELFETS